jgi:hypothetical protein
MTPIELIVSLLIVVVIVRLWPFILMFCVGWLVWNIADILLPLIFIPGAPYGG